MRRSLGFELGFTIDNDKVIRLSKFCTMYQWAITQVRELVCVVMLGWDPVDLFAIRHDLTCRSGGVSLSTRKLEYHGNTRRWPMLHMLPLYGLPYHSIRAATVLQ